MSLFQWPAQLARTLLLCKVRETVKMSLRFGGTRHVSQGGAHCHRRLVGTVVMVYKDGEAFEVEFMTLDGDTFALATLMAADLRPARGLEIAHAREVA